MVKVAYIYLTTIKNTSFLVSTGGHVKQTKQENQARIHMEREHTSFCPIGPGSPHFVPFFQFHEKLLPRAKTHGCQSHREQATVVGRVLNRTCILPHRSTGDIEEEGAGSM